MDKIALDFGFIQIYWYSICIFIGVLFATVYIIREAKKRKINEDFTFNLIFYTIICGLIGARLYFVAFNLDYYLSNPLEIIEVWNGGLAIHGGIIGGLIFLLFYTKKYNVNTHKMLDIAVVGLILGQALGRWGNFFNQEVFGASFPEIVNLPLPKFIIDGMFIDGVYRQPLFLYESIGCFVGFIVLLLIKKYKYLKNGQLTGVYLIWYGILRFILEGMRDQEYNLQIEDIKVAQVVSIILVITGIIMLIKNARKGMKLENLYRQELEEQVNF